MMSKLRKPVIVSIVIVLTVISAYFIGIGVGEAINSSHDENYKTVRRMRTIELLEQMGSVNIGDTVSLNDLSNLNSHGLDIRTHLAPKTELLFVDPGCEQCIEELKDLKSTVKSKRLLGYFVIITNKDPALLNELLDDIGLACPVLVDETGDFTSRLGIFTYPFNICIGPSLVIVDIIAGRLIEDDINGIIDYNSRH